MGGEHGGSESTGAQHRALILGGVQDTFLVGVPSALSCKERPSSQGPRRGRDEGRSCSKLRAERQEGPWGTQGSV